MIRPVCEHVRVPRLPNMEYDQGFKGVVVSWTSRSNHFQPPPTFINQRPLHPCRPFTSRLRSTRRPCPRWESESLPRINLLSAIQLSRLPSLVFSTFCPQLMHPSISTGASNMLLPLPVSANPGSSLPIAFPPMQPVTGTFLSTLYCVDP
jgi:hypothetical protein